VPTFLFINKMDLAGTDSEALLQSLRRQLSDGCLDFSLPPEALHEEAAMGDEEAMSRYLEEGALSDEDMIRLIRQRKIFPCWFGSALRLEGVEEFLQGLERWAKAPVYPSAFGAKVYKITRDAQGARLTHMKITGGALRVKTLLSGQDAKGQDWEEKADQIRMYSGAKFQPLEAAEAGTVCAVTGLANTWPGQGLGTEAASRPPLLEPVLNYQVLLPDGTDPLVALGKLRQLEEEDPQLHIVWNERLQEIHIQLMGQVQLEILRELIPQRFGLQVDFGAGSIVYKETITAPAEGIGHYEPLRHYAEVHLLLEPGEPGSGLRFAASCSEDELDRNWQRLILTHLMEKPHLGVLTGSPITDLRITLIAGRAHLKHTEGGDFRQATYRAVRQGLMSTQSALLEPWYQFRLEIPGETLGRAMNDLQQMGAQSEAPETDGVTAILRGAAPVAAMSGYWQEVTAYTRGRGRLSCTLLGYRPCHNAEEVIAAAQYDPERDVDNPPDSVFCDHGAGFTVKWDEVPRRAHIVTNVLKPKPEPEPITPAPRRSAPPPGSREEEQALQAIFERTYGQIRRREFQPPPKRPLASTEKRTVPPRAAGPEYLLVDGYNIIFAWDELKDMARTNLDAARLMLQDVLCNYQGYKKCVVILVFDAYRVKGNPGSVDHYRNIHVVYTKEAETADTYIERATYEIAKNHRVRVATSDNLEQMIILGHGAVRVSAADFRGEVESARGSIRELIEQNNRGGKEFNTLRHRAVIKEES